MKRQISSFISGSCEQQDRKIVDWFSRTLRKHDVEPIFIMDIPEPRPPPDKIKEYIQNSDVFIAIVTRRDKIEGKNLWKGPDWVQNEIGMAVQQKKPFAVFVEEGIDPSQGISSWETDYIIFNRTNLPKIKSKTEKMIEALKKQVIERVSAQTVADAVVEEPEASPISDGVIFIGRSLIGLLYGRLDASLRKLYAALLLASIPLVYFVYDYLYSYKIVGLGGYMASLIALIIFVLFVSTALGTRCKYCGSYFSVREKTIMASDLEKLPRIPDSRRYHKWQCDICGKTKFKAKDRRKE